MGEARGAAREALALAPYEPVAHVVAGNVALKAGEQREARAAFLRALELDPQNAAAHNAMGALYLRESSFGRGTKLAQAAGGFAAALRSDPSQEVSRRNLDLTLRVFLGRLTYFIFLVAFLGDVFRDSHSPLARVGPVLLLAAPAVFGWAFARRLAPALRRYLSESLRSRDLRIPLALGLASAVLVLAAAVLPQRARDACAVGSVVAAMACRVWLYLQMRQHARQHGIPIRAQRFTTPVLRWVAGSFAFMAAFLLLFVVGKPGAGSGALPSSVFFVAGFLGTVWLIRRRRAAGA